MAVPRMRIAGVIRKDIECAKQRAGPAAPLCGGRN